MTDRDRGQREGTEGRCHMGEKRMADYAIVITADERKADIAILTQSIDEVGFGGGRKSAAMQLPNLAYMVGPFGQNRHVSHRLAIRQIVGDPASKAFFVNLAGG